jgi:hypothetical protein
VDQLDDFMGRSRILVIPDQEGTGISIKALDAFALSRCFAATRPALRGIDTGNTGYQPSANARELADDVANLLASHSAREQRALIARRLYDLNYSRTVYRSAWDTMLSAVVPGLLPKTYSVSEQDEEVSPHVGSSCCGAAVRV